MAKARTLVGLDVHAAKIVAAILDSETGELRFARLGGASAPVVGLCSSLPGPVRTTYEAGPTGYELARELIDAGVECQIAAPGKIPRGATDRVKTDRRDAEHLVRLLLAGKLALVRIPGRGEEAMRDLVRAREDLRSDLMRTRHRLAKLLMRHGYRYQGPGANWGPSHLRWIESIELPEPAAQATLLDYRGAIGLLLHRRDGLDRQIEALLPDSPWEREVARLRCLRGVDTLTAVGLCAEVGEFARFGRAGQLMSYLGLVPSEHSSGESRRLGSITKTGSRHARRLMVEAAWHYRRIPAVGKRLAGRQEGQPGEAVAISWSAQRRLHRTFKRLSAKGKRPTVVTVAVARELAGFCWAIAQIE